MLKKMFSADKIASQSKFEDCRDLSPFLIINIAYIRLKTGGRTISGISAQTQMR